MAHIGRFPRAVVCATAILLLAGAGGVRAQGMAPPPGSEAAAASRCLCLQEAMQSLGAQMQAKTSELDSVRHELANDDAQLHTARSQVDVNNPQSVDQFKALLDHRDRTFERSTGPLFSEAATSTRRYNHSVNAYNADCADRPMSPALMAQLRPTLSCPPIQ